MGSEKSSHSRPVSTPFFVRMVSSSIIAGVVLQYVPIPTYKTNDPDLWNCKKEWMHSTTLLRHTWDRK